MEGSESTVLLILYLGEESASLRANVQNSYIVERLFQRSDLHQRRCGACLTEQLLCLAHPHHQSCPENLLGQDIALRPRQADNDQATPAIVSTLGVLSIAVFRANRSRYSLAAISAAEKIMTYLR